MGTLSTPANKEMGSTDESYLLTQKGERILYWAVVDRAGVMEKAEKGFQIRLWAQSQYGKGFGKQKGLNELCGWSQDVPDLKRIHALRSVPSSAEFAHCSFIKPRSIAAAPW